ncbi:DUF317 domain-containing protein [Streptacidiphilus sp. MAP5-52]|uniref:DUF317 domain-containing protein n=1 Tax=Streptacidiphilus sp. MAP5-52 TaxID=3156267 RepID=UPI003512D420
MPIRATENPITDPQPITHLDVTRRHLAGPTSYDTVLAPLVLAYDWSHQHNHLLDQTFVSSPDHRFRIGMNQPDPGAWWRITAAREPLGPPQWMAGFSKDIPTELIAAVTGQLHVPRTQPDWTGEEHPALQEGQFDGAAVLDNLHAAGWHEQPHPTDGTRHLEAPDHLAHAWLRPNADRLALMGGCAFAVEAGPEHAGFPYWQALFTADTPAVITNAFTAALLDPAPLRRDAEWMDEQLLAHLGYYADTIGVFELPPRTDDPRSSAARARAKTGAAPASGAPPTATATTPGSAAPHRKRR